MVERSVAIFDRSKMVEKIGMLQLRPAETAIVTVDMHRGHRNLEVATIPAKAEDRARAMANEKRVLDHARGRRVPLIDFIRWGGRLTERKDRIGCDGQEDRSIVLGSTAPAANPRTSSSGTGSNSPPAAPPARARATTTFRQVPHTPAWWLVLALRNPVPRRMPLRWAEFATLCQSSRSTPGWSRGRPAPLSASARPVPTPSYFACRPEP